MKLYDLGHVPWIESQLIYHAMPRLGMEGILYIAPAMPYVCIGCHQDVEQDIDLDFCQVQGIPVFRRQIGGSEVYLDGDQIFYQIILHQDNPLAAGGGQGFVEGRPLAELGGRAIPLRKSLELAAEALVQGEVIPKVARDLLASHPGLAVPSARRVWLETAGQTLRRRKVAEAAAVCSWVRIMQISRSNATYSKLYL